MSVITPMISDRGPKAWAFYNQIYTIQNHNSFNLIMNDNSAKIYLSTINDDIILNGDVIFNFKETNQRLNKYLAYVSDSALAEEYRNKFDSINPLLNISLLISDGNLQGSKQGIGFDRGDTFLWALDQYFNDISEIVLNHATWQMAQRPRDFLEYIKTMANCNPHDVIFYYCLIFYNLEINISNKELIRDLIHSGSRAIDNEHAAIRYMDLALRFWNARKTSINNYTNLDLQLFSK